MSNYFFQSRQTTPKEQASVEDEAGSRTEKGLTAMIGWYNRPAENRSVRADMHYGDIHPEL